MPVTCPFKLARCLRLPCLAVSTRLSSQDSHPVLPGTRMLHLAVVVAGLYPVAAGHVKDGAGGSSYDQFMLYQRHPSASSGYSPDILMKQNIAGATSSAEFMMRRGDILSLSRYAKQSGMSGTGSFESQSDSDHTIYVRQESFHSESTVEFELPTFFAAVGSSPAGVSAVFFVSISFATALGVHMRRRSQSVDVLRGAVEEHGADMHDNTRSQLATEMQSQGSTSSLDTVAMAAEEKKKLRRFFFGDIFKDGNYEPLHPELFSPGAATHWSKWLSPEFFKVAAAVKDGDPRSALREECPGVYSFPLFTPEFCDLLLEEVEHAQSTRREMLERPNGMNRYGIVLNQLGLEPIISSLQQDHLKELQAALFPQEGLMPDDHHCFIVRYMHGEDVGLDMHEDDSDVTLNVCLGKEFKAATLSFCGLVTDDGHRKLSHTYSHEKGRAVLHVGRHRHGADNIESGERVNFILWSTSSQYRRSESYMQHRQRRSTAADPDPICLSYTHDYDYATHLETPSKESALARGVMLDQVMQRYATYNRPVHDLSNPLPEINEVPSVCLFLEDLPRENVQQLFGEFMAVASSVLQRSATDGRPFTKAPPILFFVAAQTHGAVPQIRRICGVEGSPAFAVLDIEKECCHRLDTATPLDGASMAKFVEDFMKGGLPPSKLNGG